MAVAVSIRARYVTGITTVESLEDETSSTDEAAMRRRSEAEYRRMECERRNAVQASTTAHVGLLGEKLI
jgi:hypothetical protein